MDKIKHKPKHKRPREKMIEQGRENLKTFELLAILFNTGTNGKNVIEFSKYFLKKTPLAKFNNLTYNQLLQHKGINQAKACTLLACLELNTRINLIQTSEEIITSPKTALPYFFDIRKTSQEKFLIIYLNARSQIIDKKIISVGLINASLVHPREVFKPAIEYLACSVLVGHNHPSGKATPSEEDKNITQRLKEAGKILGIDILDHIIVTKDDYFSFKQSGLL